MSIKVTQLPDAERRPRHVAIGTFDGVHVGHRQVIDGADTVLTFEPHPLSVIHPEAAPKLIMPFEIKRDVIEGLGVEELVVIPFDEEFSTIAAEEFCSPDPGRDAGRRAGSRWGRTSASAPRRRATREMLASRERVRDPGRAAGRGRRRDRLLDPDPRRWSPPARSRARCAASARRSCSRGRWSRATGAAASSASRPPTSCPPTTCVCPGHGVYAAFANGQPAAVNVGVRPTFETGRGLLIEAYLIDYDGDLYGQTLRVAFIGRLRGERRFPSVEELVAQMHRDVEAARELCASFTPCR